MDHTPTVEVLELDTDHMILDSTFRDVSIDPDASNFNASLTGAPRNLKRIFHQTLTWTQPLYAHNKESMEILVTYDGTEYVALMTPYYTHISPDGTDLSVPFGTPVDGSYAADLEGALNKMVEPVTRNIFVPPDLFTVRYSQATGFVIRNDTPFTIHDTSTWLTLRNHTHGFGENVGTGTNPVWSIEPDATVLMANAPPTLNPCRYFSVSSDEAARNRRTASFSNNENGAITSQEMNVFNVEYKNNNVLHTQDNTADPTIINVNSVIQSLRVTLVTDKGELFISQSVWTKVFNAASALSLSVSPADLCTATRSDAYTAILFEMYSGLPTTGVGYSRLLRQVSIRDHVIMNEGEIVHNFTMQSKGT